MDFKGTLNFKNDKWEMKFEKNDSVFTSAIRTGN